MIFPKKKISKDFLSGAAPIEIWEAALREAKRSPLKTFKTGAVLYTNRGVILSKGCSHNNGSNLNAVNTIHAEMDALNKAAPLNARGLNCLICTIGRSSNPAWSSRPCYLCAKNLYEKHVNIVIYLERTNSGGWIINQESPFELLTRSNRNWEGKYAKDMRI